MKTWLMQAMLMCICLIYGEVVEAQSNIDSLRAVYESESVDTLRYQKLVAYEKAVRAVDRVAATPLMRDRIQLSKKIGQAGKLAGDYITLGNNFMFLSQNDSALVYLNECLNIDPTKVRPIIISSALNSRAVIEQRMNRYEDAITTYNEVIVLTDSLGDRLGLLGAYINLGTLIKDQEDCERAEPYFVQALEIVNDGDRKDAFENLYAAISELNIGQCQMYVDSLENAEDYLLRSLSSINRFSEGYQKTYYSSNVFESLASVKLKKWEYGNKLVSLTTIENEYKKALSGFTQISDQRGITSTLIGLGRAQNAKGELEEAKTNLERAVDLATEIGFKERKADALLNLSINAELRGDTKTGLNLHQEWVTVRDSIRNDKRDKEFSNLQIRFQTADKERELLKAEVEITKQRKKKAQQLYAFLISSLLLLGGGMVTYNRYKLKKEREVVQFQKVTNEAMERFVPNDFIGALGHTQITDVELGDQVEKEVTVVFTDIRDFTSISEKMSPKENFDFVNEYAGLMGPIIEDNGGFVNQYMGDGIMAIFMNGPQGAIKSCIQMQEKVAEYNDHLKERGKDPITVGMGVHSGKLIMGIIGDTKRRDAALISDTVNTASRLEGCSKKYTPNIIVSSSSLPVLKDTSDIAGFTTLGDIKVKGKERSITIYGIEDFESAKQTLDNSVNVSENFNFAHPNL